MLPFWLVKLTARLASLYNTTVQLMRGGGAPVEGVHVGALEELRGEFPGVEGDAFHPPQHGGYLVPGGGVMSCRGGTYGAKAAFG